ncbi:MAG: hypothetical protein GTN80_05605 [Nitrososphaeria archaeon]|nr:hypothetical protein [Nitrososphaeria archaeon]NIN52624.1 hypothetical protein [Nitrososphaeria archaeon]NIQ33099.1 hypothetical protein [Nitrososphaeria archaeon]
MSIDEISQYIKRKFGAPGQDKYDLPTSEARFPDGAHFRTEILPTTVEEYEKVFSLCEKYDFVCNKITDTRGSMFDTDEEIIKKCEMCRDRGIELVMSPGTGEHYSDISHQMAVGAIVQGKSRGMDMLVRNIADMMRDLELGCRGFLVYDEGMMLVCFQMRRDGLIPPETTFKISACISVANPLALKFWIEKAELEPNDSVNPVRDLTMPMLAAMRAVSDQPLDLHAYWSTSLSRTLDTPEIVRVAAPVYFKISRFGPGVTIEERVLQGLRIVETVQRYYPEAKQSPYRAQGTVLPAKFGAWKPKLK